MKSFFSLILFTIPLSIFAQEKVFSKTGIVTFFSKAPIENIEARNTRLLSVWNMATAQMEFSILMKGFEFKKALMQEHFNENYVESDKYPKANFIGKINDPQKIITTADGIYQVSITGFLTLHGVTKPLQVPAIFTVKNNTIGAASSFTIQLSDYNIKIPAVVKNNINNTITIHVSIPSFQSF